MITDYAAINVRSRSQQRLQALSLSRAMRLQRHAFVLDVITDYTATNGRRRC